jgi:transposase-like protein
MVRSSAKSIEWSKRLDRFQISGMTLSRFCKHENVSPHSFYYWKKQLDAAKGRQRRSKLGHVVKADIESPDIRVRCTLHAGAIRIECHIESPQALNAILSWAASQQGNSQQNSLLFQQLVVQD